MMKELPDFLSSGDEARLFPVLAETSKEKRVASIFLAVMTQIPALAKEVLASTGVRVGKRTTVQAFTEVVFREKAFANCRPDGLIVIDTGRTRWSALIEAKIGKNGLDVEQVQRYVEIARAQGIDAVITVSNQFVSRADHSPVNLPKTLLRRVSLFHWSWTWLATICEILGYQNAVDDTEQFYLLAQLNDFLAHPATGVERFTQMAAQWKDIVQSVANDEKLKKSSSEVEASAASWIAEERDLCLHMSSHVGTRVDSIVERKLREDPAARLKEQISSIVETHMLTSKLRVPDCASDIDLCADIARKTVSVSMTVKAPTDRKSTKARLNWLLRMLPQNDERIFVRALWPGRCPPTMKPISLLREEPELIQTDNLDLVPHGFEILMIEGLGKRFGGRRTVIEDIERIVPEFYDLVGANLKAWQAPPPKPVKSRTAPDPGELEPNDLGDAGSLP
ncbi:hypothetical protein [Thioclava sp. IC9]|uniref:hypothetical protein n=1 Tax=Thioclava sp. IC9 TaxID=1973007 RepID=UPI000B53F5FB|nr:hypothetical protein [Thioclava sp. IC9]OWX99793.1 hypothetical protein B6V76_17650 [Thioclava sp. IC9]